MRTLGTTGAASQDRGENVCVVGKMFVLWGNFCVVGKCLCCGKNFVLWGNVCVMGKFLYVLVVLARQIDMLCFGVLMR